MTLRRSRLDPAPWQADYVQLRAIRVQMERRLARRWQPGADISVLDVGCAGRPYEPLLRPYTASYVGLDVEPGEGVDIVASAESLPVQDRSFDCVLCTQVLQLVPAPTNAVREMHRVIRPGGLLFLSTHGVGFVDRASVDRWRWTQDGLRSLLEEAGEWENVEVLAAGGVMCAGAYLIGGYAEFAAHHAGAGPFAVPVCLALNALAWTADRAVRRASPQRPYPDASVNYLAAAVKPR